MEQHDQSEIVVPNGAYFAIGVAIGLVLTFWLGFGIMMELSPLG